MKIRTDFVTNSSSSSFTLVINFELTNGKNVRFVGGGFPDDCCGDTTEEPGYYGYELTMDVSPKTLGTATSVEKLIDLLKGSVCDCGEYIFAESHPKYVDSYGMIYDEKPEQEVSDDEEPEDEAQQFDAYDFIKTIESEITSMNDIAKITVEGNEDYGYRAYNQSYTYDRKAGTYTGIEENSYDDEIEGYHGGELQFEIPDSKDMEYIESEAEFDDEDDDWD